MPTREDRNEFEIGCKQEALGRTPQRRKSLRWSHIKYLQTRRRKKKTKGTHRSSSEEKPKKRWCKEVILVPLLKIGPAERQDDEKLVHRLNQLFSSTEIFSKRRKICALWRKTRATVYEDVTAVCRKRYANASGNNLEPRSFLLLGLLPMGMRMRINRWQYCIENEGELRLILWKFLIRCSWFLSRLLIHFPRLHSAWCSK